MPDDRVTVISDYLRVEMSQVGAEVIELPAASWSLEAPADPAGGTHRPFGYLPPLERTLGFFVFHCSPELISAQTAALDDAELARYLRALSLHAHLHIVHADRDLGEVERLIDSVSYDIDPETAVLVNRVQMGAAADPG